MLDGVSGSQNAEKVAQLSESRHKFERLLERILESRSMHPPNAGVGWRRLLPRWLRLRIGRDDALETFVRLSSKLEETSTASLYKQAYFGLLRHQSDPNSAARIAADLEFRTTRNAPIRMLFRGTILFLVLYISFWFLLTLSQDIAHAISQRVDFITVGLSGVVGAMISLAIRRDEFSEARGKSPLFYQVTGGLLPFIGSVFGCVVYALLISKMIDVSFGGFIPKSEPFVDGKVAVDYLSGCIVIGFLSGFSERFAKGMLGRVGGNDEESSRKG